jgi:hypothetical protein
MELVDVDAVDVDKDERFPQAGAHPVLPHRHTGSAGSAIWYRIMRWQLGLGADVMV